MTEIIHDTSRLDAWLSSHRERESAAARAEVYQARANSYRELWKSLLAGAAGAAIVVCAVWVAMPKFMHREIEIPVLRLSHTGVDVPNITKRDVTIEVPHIVTRDVFVDGTAKRESAPASPASTLGDSGGDSDKSGRPFTQTGSSALPPKAPTDAEEAFISRPAYKSADLHGRIVGPKDNGFEFDNGSIMVPARIVRGRVENDPKSRLVVRQFIGDYAYCNRESEKGLFKCMVIHDDKVQNIPNEPAT